MRHHPSPSRGDVVSIHRAKDRAEHQQILNKAFRKRCVVYYARVEEVEGKHYAIHPWVADLESFDALYKPDGTPKVKMEKRKCVRKKINKTEVREPRQANGLFCPFCSHRINSTPGRTLHVKSKHPEKLGEYQEWLGSLGKS
jgi:hypothetical protein